MIQAAGEAGSLEEGSCRRKGEQRLSAWKTRPAVSCFCLTYGRPELLEEAIFSFLQQDYAGPKEMIVLNDYADQVLTFDHPEVQVVNVPRRFRTLGEKMNAAVGPGVARPALHLG